MKRILSISIILLTIFGIGGWVYCADQFERKFNMALSKLQNEDSQFVEIDSSKVVLKKYRFTAIINDVVFLPHSERYKIITDITKVRFNPLSKSVSISLGGDNVSIGVEGYKMYIKNPNILLRTDFGFIYNKEIFDIELCAKDIQIYYGITDDIIYSAHKFEHLLSMQKSNISDENLKLSFKADWKEFEFFVNNEFIQKVLLSDEYRAHIINAQLEDKHLDMVMQLYELLRATGPINYDGMYNLDIKKEYVHDLFQEIHDGKDFLSIIFKIDFKNSKYHFDVTEQYKNPSVDNKISVLVAKADDNEAHVVVDIDSNINYDDKTLVKLKDVYSDLLFGIYKLYDIKNVDNRLSKNDFVGIASMLADIKQSKIYFDARLNNDNAKLDTSFSIDNYKFMLNGELQKNDFNGTSSLSDPKAVIHGIANLYDNAILPIITKLYAQNDPSAIKVTNMFISNVKDNGYEALLAFHKEDSLKENDSLITDWSFDSSNFHLKINGNSFWKIATDERLVKFMQNMPDAKSYEEHKKELEEPSSGGSVSSTD